MITSARYSLPAVVLFVSFAALAAAPPSLVNYQGVLRDAADRPLDGDYDMVFRFWSAWTAGSEILVDQHTRTAGGQVTVSGGLFNVTLGAGSILDGAGPGTYTSLGTVFRDYESVWLGIDVGTETLAPRIRIVAAAYSLNAANLDGRPASSFIDTSSAPQTKSGQLTLASPLGGYGVDASGLGCGGRFVDSDGTGIAYAGYGDTGIVADGTSMGGNFHDSNSSGYAYVGYGNYGVYAQGDLMGGYFRDSNGSGYAYSGYGDTGVRAGGDASGAYFLNTAGDATAYLADSQYGIRAGGSSSGGYFFTPGGSGYAYVGDNTHGIRAFGGTAGGYFQGTDGDGYAYLGKATVGVVARGVYAGGDFLDIDDGGLPVYVATSTYKIKGPGAVSFVQNHPVDKDKVIVYAAPEGDEVAVYTRGTARLASGEARVPLGETFRHVTNPDLGLTVYLTPVGGFSDLYVASKSTREIVVRSAGGDDGALFDYIVWGLRIGFEELAIVQEKTEESFIPSMKTHRELYARRPELRGANALERFKAMETAATGRTAFDLTGAAELRDTIHEFDPAVDRRATDRPGRATHEASSGPANAREGATPGTTAGAAGGEETGAAAGAEAGATAGAATGASGTEAGKTSSVVGLRTGHPSEERALAELHPRFEIDGPVEAGDLLALDPSRPGTLVRANVAADPLVVGIAAGPAENRDGKAVVPVVGAGFARVRADASYGEIRAGDLLVASATPGHAMRAPEGAPARTVVGKAIDPLVAGTGVIRVLVTSR